jgi:hypothetical protein
LKGLLIETPNEINVYFLLGWIAQKEKQEDDCLRYFLDAASCRSKPPPILREIITKLCQDGSLPDLDSILSPTPEKLVVYSSPARNKAISN